MIELFDIVNFAAMLLAATIGALRFRMMTSASRVFCILVLTDLCTEFIAFYVARRFHNNLPVYNIYSLLEFSIVCIYFNHSIDVFKKWNIGLYAGVVGIIAGISNIVCFQPIIVLNSYFLFFEGIVILIFSLFSISRWLLLAEQPILHKLPAFWFSVLLSFFWSVTFLSWGAYDYFSVRPGSQAVINMVILLINIFFYAGVITVFLFYPKMRKYE